MVSGSKLDTDGIHLEGHFFKFSLKTRKIARKNREKNLKFTE